MVLSATDVVLIIVSVLLIVAYGTLVFIVHSLVQGVLSTLRLAWATLQTMEQMLYYARNDISKLRQHQDRFFGIYGYINPAYREREKAEEDAEKAPLERTPDI